MKNVKMKSIIYFIAIFAISITLSSCKDDPFATITINSIGSDLGGDVVGDGGTTSSTNTWNNPSVTANWTMDMTAAAGGSFQLIIKDSAGSTVLDNTLIYGVGDDSASGVTSSGTAGNWTITVKLTNFNGDGSFSISPGN